MRLIIYLLALLTAQNALAQQGKSFYCPKASDLQRQDFYWIAPGGWRSYDTSFSKSMKEFAGAQWQGLNVGKVLCVYKGASSGTFPVILQRGNLVITPHGHSWYPLRENNLINCDSSHIEDCPFYQLSAEKGPSNNQELVNLLNSMKPEHPHPSTDE